MDYFIALGMALVTAGCASIYLASPHQRWLSRACSAFPSRLAGVALLVGGLMALLQSLYALAASFVFITALMLLFILLPYVGALISLYRKPHK